METARASTQISVHDVVENLLLDLSHSAEMYEQRGNRRMPIGGMAMLGVSVGETGRFQPLYPVWVTEISSSGIGLLIEHDLPLAAKLLIKLDRFASQPCQLPIRVVYCAQVLRNTYKVGAAFEMG